MKKGINVWAFPQEMPLEQVFATAKEFGFEGVELVLAETGPVSMSSSKEDMETIRQMAQKAGIQLYSLATGLYWDYSLTSQDEAVREKAMEIGKKQIELAQALGCEGILVIPGAVETISDSGKAAVDYDVAYDWAVEAAKVLGTYAEEYNIAVGIENVWNKFLLSPLEMRQFLKDVDKPTVGTYFDVGNVLLLGYPEQWVKILGNTIQKVHFKDFKRSIGTLDGFVDLLEGDVDYKAVMAALKKVGYDGWVTAEVFPREGNDAMLCCTSKAMDYILSL